MGEESRRRRTQALVDIGMSVGIAVLVWPFPLARSALSPGAHVAALLGACVLVGLAYHAVSATVWQRTVGMRLTGRTLVSDDEAQPGRGRLIVWGLASAVLAPWYALTPVSACRMAWPEQLAKLRQAPAED